MNSIQFTLVNLESFLAPSHFQQWPDSDNKLNGLSIFKNMEYSGILAKPIL